MEPLIDSIDQYSQTQLTESLEDYPSNIYHYTDANGIYGILSSNKIWATNIGYLNDTSELVYSTKVITNCINELLEKISDKTIIYILETLLNAVSNYKNTYTDFYISCFCQQSDQLSQWRAYGANGGGYTLGFYTSLIGKDLNTDNRNFDLRRVIYDPIEQKRIIYDFFDFLVKQLEGALFSKKEIRESELLDSIYFALLEYMLSFKDPSFSEEEEWRLIYTPKVNEVNFRTRGNNLIPYVELDLTLTDAVNKKHLPLCDVVIGPTNIPEKTLASLNLLCEKYEHQQCEITLSKIPLTI